MPFGKKNFEKAFIHLKNLGKSKSSGGTQTQSNAELSPETSFTDTDWFSAIRNQDVNKVKEIIESGKVDINAADQYGWPALHLCAWNGFTQTAQALTDASSHCDINQSGPNNSTALSLACQRGHTDIAHMMLKAGCDINLTSNLGKNQDVSALHLAAENGHVEIVKLLLQHGVSPNVCMNSGGVTGVTALHLAVEAGHMQVIDILIEAGCDVQSSTKSNKETNC